MFFILAIIFPLSCTSRFTSTSKLLSIKDSNGQEISVPDSFEMGKVIDVKHLGQDSTLFSLKFDDFKKASQYAMERRLLILRKYETFIEPYFGTPSSEECTNNLRSSMLEVDEKKLISILSLLTFGENRILNDCLIKNNTHWVQIELLVCDQVFYDLRTYYPIGGSKPDYKQSIFCEE